MRIFRFARREEKWMMRMQVVRTTARKMHKCRCWISRSRFVRKDVNFVSCTHIHIRAKFALCCRCHFVQLVACRCSKVLSKRCVWSLLTFPLSRVFISFYMCVFNLSTLPDQFIHISFNFICAAFQIFLHICSFLKASTLVHSLSLVCKQFYLILKDDSLWKARINRMWPDASYPLLRPG